MWFSLYRWAVAVLLAAFVLGILCLTSTPPYVHAATVQTLAKPHLTRTEAQRIVVEASKYVHVVDYKATVDSQIRAHLTASEVVVVQNFVDQYNSLPRARKLPQSGSGTGRGAIQPNAFGCNQYFAITYPWYGTRIYMNHCLINTLATVGIAGAIGAFAASIAPLGVVIGLYVGALVLTDNNCGQKGAYLDDYLGVWWVNGIC